MADIQQNNNPLQPVSTDPVSPAPVTNTPPVNPQGNNASDINTGQQYEVDAVHPEDLDMSWTRLKCLVCNYTYEGMNPIKKCPRCGNEDPDKFSHAD